MRRTLLAFLVLAFPANAVEPIAVPEVLLGQWETDPANCQTSAPTSGQQAWFSKDRGGGVVLSQVNHDTEGGSYVITGISQVGRDIMLAANCWMEEAQAHHRSHLLASLKNGDQDLVLQSDWMNEGPITFHRCTAEDDSAVRSALEQFNAPMDIGLDN